MWHVSIEQINLAIERGQIASKQENGFTFIDVAPHSGEAALPSRPPAAKPITYKLVRHSGPVESYHLPRAAEIITPAEIEGLTGQGAAEEPASEGGRAAGAMGDWRRGRSHATGRRNPPNLNAA